MRKYLLLCLFLLLAACAKAPVESPIVQEDAMGPWEKMLAHQPDGPWRIQFSMRFGEEGDTRRVTGLLWSNGRLPLRLDVMAGAGATVAKISDQPGEFLIYVPQENRAYYQEGATKPRFNFGTPLPLGILQIADLLSGRFGDVFGKAPVSMTVEGNMVSYGLENPPGGTLTLDEAGLPQTWEIQGWKLQFAYDEEWGELPKSLRLDHRDGKYALILVKEREDVGEPFSSGQLELELPPGTPRLPIGKFKN